MSVRPATGGRLDMARSSSGTVLVLVALMLPVLIGMGGLVIDIGNWFAHKRHLQVQADAGVLAGALQFRIPCDPSPIIKAATDYSSVTLDQGAGYTPPTIFGKLGYNPQIGGTAAANLNGKVNSDTYFPTRATPLDTTVAAGDPCAAKMLDVKVTETDLPWFLKAASVSFIDAHARVELQKERVGKKLVPLGIPNINPKKVRAFFVDESKSSTDAAYVIAFADLDRTGTAGPLAIWSNPVAVSVPIGASVDKIGVRIALGDTSAPLTGTYTAICASTFVNCYDKGAAAKGLVQLGGWPSSTAGTLTAPKMRGAELLPGTCADGYFNEVAGTCDHIGVRATVDFGSGTYGPSATKPGGVKLEAFRTDTPGTKYGLTFDTATGTWSAPTSLPVSTADAARVGISLTWSSGCNNGGGNCGPTGTFTNVQSTFAAADLQSGPIKRVNVTEGAGLTDANSFTQGTSHDLHVTVGIAGNIAVAASATDPVVTLKFDQGGLTGFLDCDATIAKVSDEMALGCGPNYIVNTGHACPYANAAGERECVDVTPGNKVGQTALGLNMRILGDEKPANNAAACIHKNHWNQYATGLPDGDPRIMQMFITPVNAFDDQGNHPAPIVDFAAFYVTGWQGTGASTNPCQTKLAPTDPERDDPAQAGEIVGHFISYVDHKNSEGSDVPCDFTSLTPCVTIFTR